MEDYKKNVSDTQQKVNEAKEKVWEKLFAEGYGESAIKEVIDFAEKQVENAQIPLLFLLVFVESKSLLSDSLGSESQT